MKKIRKKLVGTPSLLVLIFLLANIVVGVIIVSMKNANFNIINKAQCVYFNCLTGVTNSGCHTGYVCTTTPDGCNACILPTPTPICTTGNIINVTQKGDQYTFSIIGLPCGQLESWIIAAEAAIGKNYFIITVNPSADPYLSKLLDDVKSKLPTRIVKNNSSVRTKKDLTTIVNAIYNTVKEKNISYYHWDYSKANFINYVSSGTLLIGDRLKKGFYTCFESALLTKQVLSELGIPTIINNDLQIHIDLIYRDSNHTYLIEPLLPLVY
jgi:hypothetical protein